MKVSIIIPNFNRAKYLEETLISIRNQSYLDWEAIVVDDGSTDDSKNIVYKFSNQDSRFKWIERVCHQKGASVCRNLGIEAAKGEYIILLDSDDLLAPHCLQQRVEVMQGNPMLDFAVFKMQFFRKKPGDDLHVWNLETGEDNLSRFLKLDSVWQTTGPIWRKTALISVGLFDSELQCWQDIDIHLKALGSQLNYRLFYQEKVDCYYRKDAEGSISQQNISSLPKLKSKAKLSLWAAEKLKELNLDSNQLVIQTLGSSINALQVKFFLKFYFQARKYLIWREKWGIYKLALIYFLRLYKISTFGHIAKEIKSKLFVPNSIGKYTNDNT